jgi:flagellar biosynthesis/type III secretory pathway M-ring protein FliF/YscJ
MGTTIAAYALAAVAFVVLVIAVFKAFGKVNKKLGGKDAIVREMERAIEADNRVHEQAGRPLPVGLSAQLQRLRALAKAAPAAWRGEVSGDD